MVELVIPRSKRIWDSRHLASWDLGIVKIVVVVLVDISIILSWLLAMFLVKLSVNSVLIRRFSNEDR